MAVSKSPLKTEVQKFFAADLADALIEAAEYLKRDVEDDRYIWDVTCRENANEWIVSIYAYYEPQ